MIRRFLADESGATAIEYGVICAVLALVVVGALTVLSSAIWSTMTKVANAV